MHPVIRALELPLEEGNVVVVVHRKAFQEEAVICVAGSAHDRGHAVSVSRIFKGFLQERDELGVCLRELEWIREGSNRIAQAILNLGFGPKQLFPNLLPLQICQLRMSDGMAAKGDPA